MTLSERSYTILFDSRMIGGRQEEDLRLLL